MFSDNDDSTKSQINSAYYSNAVVDQRNIARNQKNYNLQSDGVATLNLFHNSSLRRSP